MKSVKFSNVAPNGTKRDLFQLKEIKSTGRYGQEFAIYYERIPQEERLFLGSVSMLQGLITIYNDKGEQLTEMTVEGLRLLCEWIDQNREIKM